jgi:predicted nucleic acid-binding protein
MASAHHPSPRVFVDADVLFAGAAAPTEHRASLTILRMAEITLIQALTSEQVIVEVERNLTAKLPKALPAFHLIVSRCLHAVPDPTLEELVPLRGLAHPDDLPILAAAVRAGCPWLVTFNVRHFRPGHPSVQVLRPGDLVLRIRGLLTSLGIPEQ